jgi:acetyl-CoA acyltransferase 1
MASNNNNNHNNKRAARMLSHLRTGTATESVSDSKVAPSFVAGRAGSAKSDDDIVIVWSKRTAIGRARRGRLAQSYVEDMLATVLKALVKETDIDPAIVGDICVGTVLGNGSQRANEMRIAGFLADFPDSVSVHTINRQCSSGLQALAHVAGNITAGYYDVGIAAGVESMSLSKFDWQGSVNPLIHTNDKARACLIPMGLTSENVAARYQVSRKEQDEFSALSHAKALAATKSGKFREEIVPMTVSIKDRKTGAVKKVVVDTDGGIRPGTSAASLSKLRPVFKKGGSTTAGNASQVSDGAAAMLVMKRKTANELGLPVLGVFRMFATAGVDPSVMGIGPAAAIPACLERAGLEIKDIDVFEINEAFASQAVYCVKHLGIDINKVNPNGGAIAIGHPLGCTGARMTATLLHELHRRKAKRGIVSMCIGSGMGACGLFEIDD